VITRRTRKTRWLAPLLLALAWAPLGALTHGGYEADRPAQRSDQASLARAGAPITPADQPCETVRSLTERGVSCAFRSHAPPLS
jgi:hypothetical protein